jgi:hypothetical protein
MHSYFETRLLVAIMSPTANQAQLLSVLIGTLSANKTPTLQPTFRYTALFLTEVANHTAQSAVLEWAVRAVSLSHLGRQVEDQHLIQLSRQTYRQALLTLNAALQDPIDGLSSRTLAATILLSFYEVINCTEKDSWIRHAGGAGHLMRLRGPDRHRSGLGRASFLAYRHSLVIEAFLSRTATFLALQPWLDLSRDVQKSMSSAERTPISDVVDDFHLSIVEIPSFVQSASDADASLELRSRCLATGLAHRSNLKVLYTRLMATLNETDQQITTHPSAIPDPVFPTAYYFPTLAIGSLLCGYWAVLSIINRNLMILENTIAQQPSNPTDRSSGGAIAQSATSRYDLRNHPADGPSSEYQEESLANARASCMAVESLSTSAFLGPLYLIFALRVAWYTFESDAQEREWILERLDGLSCHLGIARRLLDVQEEEGESEGDTRVKSGRAEQSRRGSGSATQSGSGNLSQSQSPELSRRESLQQQQQQVLSREISREDSVAMGVSLQEIEIEKGSGRQRKGKEKEKGKGVVR